MNQLLTIVDDKLVIERLQVKNSEGNLTHSGDLTVLGSGIFANSLQIANNLKVNGTLTVDTINAKNIISDSKAKNSVGAVDFVENDESALDGKGINFTHGPTTEQLIYKQGGRLWSTLNVDLVRGKSFCIDGLPVVSQDSLGQSVTQSNLRKVGTLKTLDVAGAVKFGEWAFFNPLHQRIGINTENPTGALTIAENNVEMVLSSYKVNVGYVGTYNNTDFEIGTDNTTRIAIKNTGEVLIGNKNKKAVVKITGRLEVDELVTTGDVPSNKSLVFDQTLPGAVYGAGVYWVRGKAQSSFTLVADSDRFVSTDSIDLANDKAYYIGNTMVVSKTSLGDSITRSQLTRLGNLELLTVSGHTALGSTLSVGPSNDVTISRSGISLAGANSVDFSNLGITVSSEFSIICDGEQEFKVNSNGSIELGNRNNTNKKISLFGSVSVGVANPDSDVAFTVGGSVSFDNKKFIKSDGRPTAGTYKKGDVCWNTDPKATDYIGWVCVREGSPGEWLPFGQIASA